MPLFYFLKNVLTGGSDWAIISSIKQETHRMKAMKCKNWSIERKRELLDSFKGKYVHIEFLKADKSLRVATVQHMQHAMFAEGHASKAQINTVAHKPNLYTMVDVTNEKWINVSLDKLRHVKCGSVDITFEEE